MIKLFIETCLVFVCLWTIDARVTEFAFIISDKLVPEQKGHWIIALFGSLLYFTYNF